MNATDNETATAATTEGFYAVRVTERDHEKSAAALELDGGTPDRGHVDFGPYANVEEAEREAERARTYYEAHRHVNEYGEVTWDWVVTVVPWPKSRTFSDYVREQEARKQGVPLEAVDLRLVFNEPLLVAAPGERSRPSSLAQPPRKSVAAGTVS